MLTSFFDRIGSCSRNPVERKILWVSYCPNTSSRGKAPTGQTVEVRATLALHFTRGHALWVGLSVNQPLSSARWSQRLERSNWGREQLQAPCVSWG